MNDVPPCSVRLLVTGNRACFRRPEFTSDLVTYDAMPPMVARQISKAVIGSDGWELERITVCNGIQCATDFLMTARGNKRAIILRDVAYVLDIVGLETRDFLRRDGKTAVHLGLADYSASTRILAPDEPTSSSLAGSGTVDLGWMIYDTSGNRPRYFRASMVDGVIDVGQSRNRLLAS